MSEIRVNTIVAAEGTSAPNLPYGVSIPTGMGITGAGAINITGVCTAGIVTATNLYGTLNGNATGLTGTPNISCGTIAGSTGTFSGAVNVDATTDSTSTSTGALIVDGGLGVAKNVYIGAGLSVAGTLTYEDVTNVDSVGLITAKSGVNVTGGEFKVGTALTIGSAGVATFIAPAGVGVTITPATGKIEATTYYGDGSNLSNITSTTINSNADNRLITGSGTANTLNGESTLTYDGTTLALTGSQSVSSNFTVGSGITFGSAGVATFSGTSDVYLAQDVRLKFGDPSASPIKFEIFNNGTNNWILGDATVPIKIGDPSNNSAHFNTATSVDLFYANAKKFETTNDGTVTTGIATATGLHGTSNLTVGTGATIGSAGVGTFYGGVHDHRGNLRNVTQSQYLSAQHTLTAADAGGFIILANGGADLIIPNNVMSVGDMVTIINAHSSGETITNQLSGLFNAATGETGSKTLASRGMATILFINSQLAYISGAGLEDA